MKVRALSRISGPIGVKDPGEEFVVDAATGADLIGRRAVEEVAPAAVEPAADVLASTSRKKKV